MCVSCGVNFNKHGTFGLYEYIVNNFFKHAFDLNLWDKEKQIYLPPKLHSVFED